VGDNGQTEPRAGYSMTTSEKTKPPNITIDAPSWSALASHFLQPHMREWLPILLREMASRLDRADEEQRERVANARQRLFDFMKK
jgi:hypothetical protein